MSDDRYTYSYVKDLLEEDYPNTKVLFVKDMIEGIQGKFDMVASGYKHSFIIRHPKKVFSSIERIYEDYPLISIKDKYKDIFHETERFYEHVQTTLGQPLPPILDADDIIAHPEQVLTKYCDATGIAFTPQMLKWSNLDVSQLNWHCTDVGFIANKERVAATTVLTNAMKSQGFEKGQSTPPVEDLSADVMECVEHAMPVYEKLYALRIKP